MHRRVSIILFRMFHYRVDFLTLLEAELKKHSVTLDVYYGKPTPESLAKNDTGTLKGSTEVISWCLPIAGKEILLQIPPRRILGSNLIICMQENRLLINYFLQLYTRIAPSTRFAFWGHGRNFQSQSATGVRERLKQYLLRGSDWFFAYTDASKASLIESGYSPKNITVFNNTIDTETFSKAIRNITADQKQDFLRELSIDSDKYIGIFCGSMYPAKRIVELLEASRLIKEKVPDFHLICIGDGPSASIIKDALPACEWIHFLGSQKGQKKALTYSVGKLVLNPGLVGLHIVDSFSAGVPMLTMEYDYHSPEFAYIRSNENGLVTEADVPTYANSAVTLLTEPLLQKRLADGARLSAKEYSLQSMVDKFAAGILDAVES